MSCETLSNSPTGYSEGKCNAASKSCGGYKRKRTVDEGEVLNLLDDTGELFPVYCYFTVTGNASWTLVQSYSYNNSQEFLPLHKDQSRNFAHPERFEDYRLPKDKMLSIKASSSAWAITCLLDRKTPPKNGTDRLVGSTSEVDILSPLDGCKPLNNIRIHGFKCRPCEIYLKQDDSSTLHAPYKTNGNHCEFDQEVDRQNIQLPEGNYFGNYLDATTACIDSTEMITQFWFKS